MNERVLPRAMRPGGLLALTFVAFAGSTSAQDVIVEGVRQGVQPLASLLATLREDPGRFEFQRARISDPRTRCREAPAEDVPRRRHQVIGP